jgi:hypothetical protein
MYRLAAAVAEVGMLRDPVTGVDHGVVAVLRCDLAMVPVSEALLEELTGSSHGGPFAERMPPELDRALAGWSVSGPLAFLQADFFGGDGHQAATVWRDGSPAWGPAFDDRFDANPTARGGTPSAKAFTSCGSPPSTASAPCRLPPPIGRPA